MIEADGLKKRFGTTQALDGVDLAAREGTVLGVLGPNGAGKTTAVRDPGHPAAGRLRHAPASTATTSSREPQQVRRTIGLTGQYASVDEDLTGTQNLVLIGQLLNLHRPGRQGAAPPSCSTGSTSPTPPAGWPRPTPAACAAGSTWPPAWSAGRR